MCKNVIKNVMSQLSTEKRIQFNNRLCKVRIMKRQVLWVAQDGKCHYCGRDTVLPRTGIKTTKDTLATLDHIITQSNGGTDSFANLVIACSSCNANRGDMPYEEFYNLMKTPGGWENYMNELREKKAALKEQKHIEKMRKGQERQEQHNREQKIKAQELKAQKRKEKMLKDQMAKEEMAKEEMAKEEMAKEEMAKEEAKLLARRERRRRARARKRIRKNAIANLAMSQMNIMAGLGSTMTMAA